MKSERVNLCDCDRFSAGTIFITTLATHHFPFITAARDTSVCQYICVHDRDVGKAYLISSVH